LMGNEAKTDGVGIFVAEKWADSVVRVERHSERIMCGGGLRLTAYYLPNITKLFTPTPHKIAQPAAAH